MAWAAIAVEVHESKHHCCFSISFFRALPGKRSIQSEGEATVSFDLSIRRKRRNEDTDVAKDSMFAKNKALTQSRAGIILKGRQRQAGFSYSRKDSYTQEQVSIVVTRTLTGYGRKLRGKAEAMMKRGMEDRITLRRNLSPISPACEGRGMLVKSELQRTADEGKTGILELEDA